MGGYNIGSYHSNAWKSSNPNSGVYATEQSKTLDALNCGKPDCNQGGTAIVRTFPIEGNGARPSHQGCGYSEEDVSFTLNATEQHGVAADLYNHSVTGDIAATLSANSCETATRSGPSILEPQGFGESGQGFWGEGIKTLRAEGENRPSRPSNVVLTEKHDRGGVSDLTMSCCLVEQPTKAEDTMRT